MVKCSCGKQCSGKKVIMSGKTYCCRDCLAEHKGGKKAKNVCEFC